MKRATDTRAPLRGAPQEALARGAPGGTKAAWGGLESAVPLFDPFCCDVEPCEASKRCFDVVLASLLLLLALPLLALGALLIQLCDGSPVFFRQIRVGIGGRRFLLYKLRTMVPDAEERKESLLSRNEAKGGVLFKIRDDPRITWAGRILRRLSIDELPQLWNVLRGDMSLVGPRPPVPAEVLRYGAADFRRLAVRPGITGLWQVRKGDCYDFRRQVRLDLFYVRHRRFGLDLWILKETIPAVLFGKSGY